MPFSLNTKGHTMKAMLLTEPNKLEITDVETPQVGPDDVLVEVKACGICGSDVHGYDGSSGRRIPPIIMGHEAAGIVDAVGSNVTAFKPGDRVTFDSMISCGDCHFCRQGMINMCDHRRVLGVSCGDYRRHGAFAELVTVPQRIVYNIPDNLSFEHAAMIEPVSVAVHAVNRTPLELGDKALVIGAGMIGLLCIQALRAAGCGTIFVADVDDTRLERALKLGADEAFNAKDKKVRERILERTAGHGVDVALEAVGATETIVTAIESLRKGGALTLVGNIAPKIDLPLQEVVTREIKINGTCGCNGEYPQCIDLMARGAIEVESLISKVAPLEEGPSWFTRLHNAEPGLMKVILTP